MIKDIFNASTPEAVGIDSSAVLDFLDALDYNRIVLRTEKRDEGILNEWANLYEEKGNSNEPQE